MLSGQRKPVCHEPQIAEVANAKAALRTKREQRHERTGIARTGLAEVRYSAVDDNSIDGSSTAYVYCAVVACLPDDIFRAILAQNDELKLELQGQTVNGDVDNPQSTVGNLHGQRLVGTPLSQRLATANNGRMLVGK